MKICVIGDPHGNLEKIKQIPLDNIDLILLTGDLGSANLMRSMAFENINRKKEGLPEKKFSPEEEKEAFMEAYNSTIELVNYLIQYAPVKTIFGNVESSNISTRQQSKKIGLPLPYLSNNLNAIEGVQVFNNRISNFNGIRIGGSGYFIDTNWVEDFKPSDYDKKMKKAVKQTTKAKKTLDWFKSLDILVCHQPPFGFLDKVTAEFAPKHWQGKNAGSKTILEYIKTYQPKYVFCGHIHEGEGFEKIADTEIYNLGVGEYKIIEL